jgi:hypothetical protein
MAASLDDPPKALPERQKTGARRMPNAKIIFAGQGTFILTE